MLVAANAILETGPPIFSTKRRFTCLNLLSEELARASMGCSKSCDLWMFVMMLFGICWCYCHFMDTIIAFTSVVNVSVGVGVAVRQAFIVNQFMGRHHHRFLTPAIWTTSATKQFIYHTKSHIG